MKYNPICVARHLQMFSCFLIVFFCWETWRLLRYIFRDIGVYHKNGVCPWKPLIILYLGPIHFLVPSVCLMTTSPRAGLHPLPSDSEIKVPSSVQSCTSGGFPTGCIIFYCITSACIPARRVLRAAELTSTICALTFSLHSPIPIAM
jgi:hypothetical protein